MNRDIYYRKHSLYREELFFSLISIKKKKQGNVEYGKFRVTAISDCF